MTRTRMLVPALLLATALAAGGPDTPGAQWVEFKPLTQDFEVIHGDVEKPGAPFVMRIRELRGGIIPPHQHPVDEHITVLHGTVCLGTGADFDRSRLRCLGSGGYAFLPQGTMIFGETPDSATVQVHGVGPFHLHWKYPLQTFDSPDAAQAFKYRAGQKIKTKYGRGTIEKGWRSGPIIQYETRIGRELVMATESEVSLGK